LFIPDPGSGYWLSTHPGSRIQGVKKTPDPGSQIRIPNTGFFHFFHNNCFIYLNCTYNPVLRIRDVYPGSRILIFTYSGSRIRNTAIIKTVLTWRRLTNLSERVRPQRSHSTFFGGFLLFLTGMTLRGLPGTVMLRSLHSLLKKFF
jgi:hypothetical protein